MADAPGVNNAPPPATYQDEQYFRTLAGLEHQLNTTLAGDKETLSNAESSYRYNNSLISEKEPVGYAQNRNRAVNEGIAQSGINTGRRGLLAQGFQNQRNRLTTGLTQERTKVQRGEEQARYSEQTGAGEQARLAEARGKQRLEREPPNEIPVAPAAAPAPPQVPTITAQRQQPSSSGEPRYYNRASGRMETARQIAAYRARGRG